MVDFIIVLVILLIVGVAIAYIVREKKRGVKCIGCPSAGTCPHSVKGECHCRREDKN